MKRLLLTLAVISITILVAAQERNFWTPVSESSINKNLFANRLKPQQYQLFRLQETNMKTNLRNAPSEKSISASASSFIITVPTGNGKFERFSVVDAPVMDDALGAKYPSIRSYAGRGIDDPSSTIRFDVSPLGFHAMILSFARPTIYIDPIDPAEEIYMVVSRKDMMNYPKTFQCLTNAMGVNESIGNTGGIGLRNADDGRLRTYRLALCATGEYSQFWLNGTEANDAERKAKVLAAQNNAMTMANAIFEKDFGLRLILVANNDAVIYLNPNTDPWTNNLNSTTQQTCDNVIGSANYDIGHLVHRAGDNGNAGCIACVCKNGSKGSGFTSYMNLTSDFFVIDYLTHEMGHQLGANHTFTFSNEGTFAQVEPGSGSTIMGYAGITGATTDVQPHSDDYFHAVSIQQITDYIKSGSGAGCAVVTLTGNNTPSANAGANYTIPRSTPFLLTGTGSDADAGDALNYCWEQMDPRATGFSTVPSATATAGPQFRSFLAVSNPSRSFPGLSSILSGTNSNKWEVLPSVNRTLNFRFTVRDNHSGAGNNNSDDMIVTVSSAVGPFAVTAPNTAVVWGSGTTQNVTWSVNGTNGAPVNCANVNILLSTDGGQTFPITLAANTPNDGTQPITVPNNPGSTCRVKVEAAGNIFFDISNTNFTIGTPPACGDPNSLTTTNITTSSATLNWNAVSGAASYDVDYKQSSSLTWLDVATGITFTSVNLSGLNSSTSYDWRVRANCSGSSGNFAISTFTTNAVPGSCPGIYDVSTNGSTGGAAQIPLSTDVMGLLSPRGDNDYYRFDITTGGTITITLNNLPANYQLALVNNSGSQVAVSQNNGTANETINATIAAGTWYARVYPKANANNASNCYTLRVTTGTASRQGDYITRVPVSVNLFPNPASGVINIQLSGVFQNAEMNIYDVFGRILIKRNINNGNNKMNISGLPGGVYMMRVQKDGNTITDLKFVKQ